MLHLLLVACVLYGAICGLLLVVNLAALPRLSRQQTAGEDAPFLSIVVPARNEERAIGDAVRSLLAQRYPRLEVIVVDDRSTDRTREVLDGLTADARLTIVRGVEPPPGWLGKPHALHQGAAVARGNLLLFVDADVIYDPRAVSEAVGLLERTGADFVGLLPKLRAEGFWEAVLLPNLLCAVFFGPAFLANRDEARWIAAGGGAGNLVRRSAYEAIGGHAALRDSVIDDLRLALTVKRAGFRARTVLAHDRVAVRMYHGFGEIWRGFTKNVAYALGGAAATAFLVLSIVWTAASILPFTILVAALGGVALPPLDVSLAAAAYGILVAARAALAVILHDPIWSAPTHPLMAAVWSALLARSFYERFVRRRLLWRGREFDARMARF